MASTPFHRAVNGTTGDSMSLTQDERKALAEKWVASGKRHGVFIVNHIGAASIAESTALAAHAEAIGCAAISVMPPFFFKSQSPKIVAEWLKVIGAAAPSLPLYYYHFNAITGVFVDPLALIQACEEVGVPTFRGFKFTDFNLWYVPSPLLSSPLLSTFLLSAVSS
jgi:N-acetylneuraminate lyase